MTHRDVLLAIQHCETIADGIKGLKDQLSEFGSRDDHRKADYVAQTLARLTDKELAVLERKGRFLDRPDGHRSGGDPSPSLLRPTSQAGLRTNPDDALRRKREEGYREATLVESAVQGREDYRSHDNVGHDLRTIFCQLAEMAETVPLLGEPDWDVARAALRRLSGMARTVSRAHDHVKHVASKMAGRQSSLGGDCLCCKRWVAGTMADPSRGVKEDLLRSGYCNACRLAYKRAGCPDRTLWERQRRAELEKSENDLQSKLHACNLLTGSSAS